MKNAAVFLLKRRFPLAKFQLLSIKNGYGTVILAAESFVMKNGPLEFPSDPDAPAEEIVNCHCFVKPVVKSASPELAAHREKFNEDISFENWS